MWSEEDEQLRQKANVNKGGGLAPSAPNLGAYFFFSGPVTSTFSGKLGKAEGLSECTASDTRQTGSLRQTHLCLWVGLSGTATHRNWETPIWFVWLWHQEHCGRKGWNLGGSGENREWSALPVPFLRAGFSVRIARLTVILENYSWWVYIITFVNYPATVYLPPSGAPSWLTQAICCSAAYDMHGLDS